MQWKFGRVDGLVREQGASSVFGSILHDVVLYMEVNQDLEGAVARFKRFWLEPHLCPPPPGNPPYQIDYYVRGTNWKAFMEKGEKILRDWWSIISWDSDLTLAREHTFEVPIGTQGNTLNGTVDKLVIRYRADIDSHVVLISDYKSAAKLPTQDSLLENVQFHAYCYATTRPEFWQNLPGGRGMELFDTYRNLPRYAEWVQLSAARRMEAGRREQRHYNRVAIAVDAMAESVAMRIFVPTITGTTCRWCEFRKPCGLPALDENGNP